MCLLIEYEDEVSLLPLLALLFIPEDSLAFGVLFHKLESSRMPMRSETSRRIVSSVVTYILKARNHPSIRIHDKEAIRKLKSWN